MSDLIVRAAPRPAAADRRRPAVGGTRGGSPALIDLVGPDPVLDLTDGRRPQARPVVQHAVAVVIPDDDAVEALVDRWLTGAERAAVAAKGVRARRGHVVGRVAAKQAVQAHLASRGIERIDPSRIEITNALDGRPIARVRGARVATRHLAVSIAHGRRAAGALATTAPRRPGPGRFGSSPSARADGGIGIDIEAVEPRSARFERLALAPTERELVPLAGDDRDTWLTRLWSAKEAAAKATGLGLQGRPKDFAVDCVIGDHLRIGDRWIATERVTFNGVVHIVATTETHRTECAWHRS